MAVDGTLIVSVGLAVIGILGLYLTSIAHQQTAFRNNVQREIDLLRSQVIRLEDTRPTTGELQATLASIKAYNGKIGG